MERLSESASKQLRRDDLARPRERFDLFFRPPAPTTSCRTPRRRKSASAERPSSAILRSTHRQLNVSRRPENSRASRATSGAKRKRPVSERGPGPDGRPPGAREETLAAIRLYEQAGDRIGEAIARGNLALLDNKEGRTDDALAGLRKSEAVLSGAGPFSSGLGVVRMNLGLVLLRRGEIAEARTLLEGALSADRHAGDKRGIAADLEALARLEETAGRPETAIDYLRRAARVHASIGGKTLSRDLLARAIFAGAHRRITRADRRNQRGNRRLVSIVFISNRHNPHIL